MADYVVAPVCSFIVTLLAMVGLRPLAVAVELVDRPGGRKTHHGDVPIVGGLAMFLGVAFAAGMLPSMHAASAAVVSASAVLVVVGLLDDRFDLSPWVRLPLQFAAPLIVFGPAASSLTLSLGNPLGTGEIVLAGPVAMLAVSILVAGAVNAFNMLDGMDGLAGAVALVACLAVSAMSSLGASAPSLELSHVLGASVAAFLIFNVPVQANRHIRCFMGDAGSTLLGFMLAVQCLRISQGTESVISPITVLWFVAMPIYELLWTLIRRVSRGQSPFRPDREHLHHLLIDSGISVRFTFIIYVTFSLVLASFGVLIDSQGIGDLVAFAAFVGTGAIVILLFYRARVLALSLPPRLQRTSEDRSAK